MPEDMCKGFNMGLLHNPGYTDNIMIHDINLHSGRSNRSFRADTFRDMAKIDGRVDLGAVAGQEAGLLNFESQCVAGEEDPGLWSTILEYFFS